MSSETFASSTIFRSGRAGGTDSAGSADAATDVQAELGRQIGELAGGFMVSQAMYAVVSYHIPTLIAAGERSIPALAVKAGVDQTSLRRLLRTLAGVGLFRHPNNEPDDDQIALTPLGEMLAANTPGSARDLVLAWMETHYAPFGLLTETLRTGTPAAEIFYGRPFFDWLAGYPQQMARLASAGDGISAGLLGSGLEDYRFPPAETVADLGGGGDLLARLLRREPHRRGILFDRPEDVAVTPLQLAASGLADRVRIVAGDLFYSVPTADLYLMKQILHDWDDDGCRTILRSIAAAAEPGARLVVIELIIPAGDEPHPGKIADLTMLGMDPGRERTRRELENILAGEGFRIDAVVPVGGPYGIIEATLA